MLRGRKETAQFQRSNNYVPEHIYVTASGECFHQAKLPGTSTCTCSKTLQIIGQVQEVFLGNPASPSEDWIGVKFHACVQATIHYTYSGLESAQKAPRFAEWMVLHKTRTFL